MGKITEEMPMNITVYLGANEGSDPRWSTVAPAAA